MNRVLGLDLDTWQALSAIGSILGAAGTLWAVIVALRLAQRDSPELRVTDQLMTAIGRGFPEQEFIVITATNLGRLPTTVSGHYWEIGWWRWWRRLYIGFPHTNHFSTPLPKEIGHGQEVRLMDPLCDYERFFSTLVEDLQHCRLRRIPVIGPALMRTRIRSLGCGVITTTGAQFSEKAYLRILSRLEKSLAAGCGSKAKSDASGVSSSKQSTK